MQCNAVATVLEKPTPAPFFDKRSDFVDYPSEARPLELCSLA